MRAVALEHLSEARSVTRRHARTFSLAMRLLPAGVRTDVYLLYLVMRSLDDGVDELAAGAAARVEAVMAWALSGTARGRESEILAALAERHPALPRDAVADFCRGMMQDLDRVTVETERDLDRYCYRVAGTVGRLMAALLGLRTAEADSQASALGIAMQRTNVLRDVDEDLSRGRVYIPAETLARHGVSDLARDDRRGLLRFEIAVADGWYERGLAGVPQLQTGARAVTTAAVMYREILRQIERDGLGNRRPWRARVGLRRKAWVGARAAIRPITASKPFDLAG